VRASRRDRRDRPVRFPSVIDALKSSPNLWRERVLTFAFVGGLVVFATLADARLAQAQHDMSQMSGMSSSPALPLGIPFSRSGSGTSWLPDSSPMRAAHIVAGPWLLMVHGAAFGQYDRQNGFRGDRQFGLVDWEMLMAARSFGGGTLRLNTMTSLERLVDGPRGYPELLQSGATYHGARLTNRQHPHELVMELGAIYDHSITSNLATSLYVAAVGEPALGPVAYMHRPSAAVDPFAPIGHHWQDGSHESSGVVTGGVYSRVVKLEGSVFNGREGESGDLGPHYTGGSLDSYSGRVTVLPTNGVSLSAWGGYIFDHDPLDPGLGMQRYGASVLTSTPRAGGGAWSNAVIWGLNIHHHGDREHIHDANESVKLSHPSSSVLVESTLDVSDRLALYGRVEQVQKSGDDIGFLGSDFMQLFTVRDLSLGATRELHAFGEASVGVGARGTITLLPQTLRLTFQTRTPTGFALFVRIRPTLMRTMPAGATMAGSEKK
jgi:hypothetical protein